MTYKQELANHYKEVRARLWGAKPVVKTVENKPVVVKIESKVPFVRVFNLLDHYKLIYDNTSTVRRKKYAEIIKEVVKETGFPFLALVGNVRAKKLVLARHYLWWKIKEELPSIPIAEIGRRMDRDHTTILYGIRKHEKTMKEEARSERG